MMELWPFTNFHDLNLDWIIRVMKEWNKRLDGFFNGGGIHDYIEGVLEEHPEWVTTVMDGAITAQKLMPSFLKKVLNPFVTPEMYGAAGDGVTDDTSAIQQAINTGKTVYFSDKTYLTTEPIEIQDFIRTNYIGPGATIKYTGDETAVKIAGAKHTLFAIGNIEAHAGNCIGIYSNASQYTQYINIWWHRLEANALAGRCIDVRMDVRWCNELNFFGGMFARGAYGLYDENFAAPYVQDCLKFYNVAVEGVDVGYHFGSNVGIQDVMFYGCRHVEAQTLFEVDAVVNNLRYYGSTVLNTSKVNIINGVMNRGIFYCPVTRDGTIIGDWGKIDGTRWYIGCDGSPRLGTNFNNHLLLGTTAGYITENTNDAPQGFTGYCTIDVTQVDDVIIQTVKQHGKTATRNYTITTGTFGAWSIVDDWNVTHGEGHKEITFGGAIEYDKVGKVVTVYGQIGPESDIASLTTVATGLPTPAQTTATSRFVVAVKGDGTTRRLLVNSSGEVSTSGTLTAGYYYLSGSYISED